MLQKIRKLLNSQLYAISLYSRQIAGTLVLLFIARYLSVHDYGLFSSYKAIAGFLLIIANMGYNEYILVSSQKVVREVQLKIGFFVINAIFYTILIALCSSFCNFESQLIFLLVLARTFLDGTFFGIMLPYYQAANKFNLISYINLFYSIVTIIITAICYILKLSLIKFLILSICLGIFNFIQCSFYAKINYLLSIRYYKELFKKLDKTIFSYMGCSIGWILYNQLPSLYVSMFLSKEKAALFFAAFTISNILFLLLSAQVSKMVPEMIKKQSNEVRTIIKKNLKFIMTINGGILIFFAICGKLLLKLVYSKTYYVEAYPILLLLTLSNLIIAFASTHSTYITASGHQHLKVKIQFKGVFTALIALILLHKIGLYAPVVSYLLSAITICIAFYKTTQKLLKNKQIS